MKRKSVERKVEDYERLIFTVVKKFKMSFPNKQHRDLMQEGRIIFLELCEEEKKKPLPCDFPVALVVRIKREWLHEIEGMGRMKRKADLVSFKNLKEKDIGLYHPFTPNIDSYMDLSFELRTVANLLMNTPRELAAMCKVSKLGKSFVKSIGRYLREFKGWDQNQVTELKKQLLPLLGEI